MSLAIGYSPNGEFVIIQDGHEISAPSDSATILVDEALGLSVEARSEPQPPSKETQPPSSAEPHPGSPAVDQPREQRTYPAPGRIPTVMIVRPTVLDPLIADIDPTDVGRVENLYTTLQGLDAGPFPEVVSNLRSSLEPTPTLPALSVLHVAVTPAELVDGVHLDHFKPFLSGAPEGINEIRVQLDVPAKD